MSLFPAESCIRAQCFRSETVLPLRPEFLTIFFSSALVLSTPRGVVRMAVALGVLPLLLSLLGEDEALALRRLSGVRGESVEVRGELRPDDPRGEVGDVRVGVPDTRDVSLLAGRPGVLLLGVGLILDTSGGGEDSPVGTATTVSKVSVRDESVLSSWEVFEITEEVREI